MILTNKLYYILRVGDFATNANTKIYYSMFSCLLCFIVFVFYCVLLFFYHFYVKAAAS